MKHSILLLTVVCVCLLGTGLVQAKSNNSNGRRRRPSPPRHRNTNNNRGSGHNDDRQLSDEDGSDVADSIQINRNDNNGNDANGGAVNAPLSTTTTRPLKEPGGTSNVSGKIVDDNEATWQIALMHKRQLKCGGSLIRDDIVLTAAACIKDIEPADLLIRAGVHTFKSGGQLRKVRETIYHPDYVAETTKGKKSKKRSTKATTNIHNNIAIVHLMRPFNMTDDQISTIRLPSNVKRQLELPASLYTYGWGSTPLLNSKNKATVTKNLRKSRVKIYSARKCQQHMLNYLRVQNDDDSEDDDDDADNNDAVALVDDGIFCAGSGRRSKETISVCNDDLGSPAVDDNNMQFGVVSKSTACQTDTRTTLFTSLLPHGEWITETINQLDA